MMAARCEYQIRADWDLNPGLWSLAFASKVNLGLSMSIQRALRRGAQAHETDADIGAVTVRIYKLLWDGEYMNPAGCRVKVNGDISKISQIIGLTNTEKAMLKNYQFMSSRLSGTRQVRNSIRHVIFSSRVFYGMPVFMTVHPQRAALWGGYSSLPRQS